MFCFARPKLVVPNPASTTVSAEQHSRAEAAALGCDDNSVAGWLGLGHFFLNRALRALNKDPHLVAGAATALSPSRGLKSLSIQRGLHSGSAWASALSGPGEG